MFKPLAFTPALLLAALALAQAQIVPTSPGRQRAANRRALREAKKADAPYKDTHLAVTRQQLRRGGSEMPTPANNELRFGHDGTPHVTEPRFPGLRHRKAPAEPKK